MMHREPKMRLTAFKLAMVLTALSAGAILNLMWASFDGTEPAALPAHHFTADVNSVDSAVSPQSAKPRAVPLDVLDPDAAAQLRGGNVQPSPVPPQVQGVDSPAAAAPVTVPGADVSPTPTVSHTAHRSRSYHPSVSALPSHLPIYETWLSKRGKALKPTPDRKFKGPVGPDPADGPVLVSAGPNKGKPCAMPNGCIFIAMTTCCATWEKRTSVLLQQLLQSDVDVHIAAFDDYSTDEGPEELRKQGITVVQPKHGKGIGLTQELNQAWRYFYARDELDTMWIVNNDVQVAPRGTFRKLNACLHELDNVGPGVVSPMTDAQGLGTGTHLSAYMSWQNAAHSRHRPSYGERKIPEEIRDNLPAAVQQYNDWLDDNLDLAAGNYTQRVKTLMGFVMGFRKDHPLHWQHENRMIHGSRNSDQEYYMFQTRGIPAYTCRNTFVYHDKSGSADPRIRAAMEHNKMLTNKKTEKPGHQS